VIGAIAAVAGMVAIVTVNSGLDASLAHPSVAGVAWDATVVPLAEDASIDGIPAALEDEIAAQPGVSRVSVLGRGAVTIGDLGVPTFAVLSDGPKGGISLVTLSGRGPQRSNEITLGPATARELGVGLGDSFALAPGRTVTVVGLGLFPSDVHAQFDEGAWVTADVWKDIARADQPDAVEPVVAVRFATSRDIDEQIAQLNQELQPKVQFVGPVERPEELSNLRNVRALPVVLAIFLAVLGVCAVGLALFASVSRHRRDLAVLRALGFTRPGVRGVLAAQGTVVAAIGVIAGIPVGLIAGNLGWRAISDRVPIVFHSPVALGAIALVVPVAILGANLLSILPGRRAARLQPAIILRSE
jgi:hypothetical protein